MNMKMRVGFYVFTALSLVQFSHQMNVTSGNPCDFMTFLELGKFGIVNCSFGEPYYGIYWYSSSNRIPIIFYQDSVKKGTGYTSGEYDIYPNGSLKINTVSLHHEMKFTVEYSSSLTGIPVVFEVDITVYVKPSPTFPLINGCSNVTDSICFSQVQNQQLLCSLHEVRPNISLSWIKRTSSGDRVMPSENFVSPGHEWYTWHVSTLTKFTNSSSLQLLVCKVEKPSGLLERDESLILVQHRDRNISTIEPTKRLVEMHTKLELSCAETLPMLIVWERSPKSYTEKEVLLWYGISHGKHGSKMVYEDYSFGVSGNLEIKRTEVQHEGLYVCFSGDGLSDWVTKYQVNVYVNPEPNHLIIDGCNPNQYCVLEVDRSGNLTCSVKGIYPEIELQLKPFYRDTAISIKFTSSQLTSKRDGDTFQVSLYATYEIKDMSLEKITIICQAVGVNAKWFTLNTKLDLLFVTEAAKGKTDTEGPSLIFVRVLHTLIATTTVTVIVCLIVYFVFTKKDKDKREEAQTQPFSKELSTRNFSPKEMAIRKIIFNVMEDTFKSHGAETIGTSFIENAEEIVGKYSASSSQNISFLLDTSKALRYDHTVPFARYIITKNITSMKRYQIASVIRKCFREDGQYEYEELYQCDFDIVTESKSVIPGAECLQVVTDILQKLGFENFETKVNHQKILEGLFEACAVPEDDYDNLIFHMEHNFTNPSESLEKELAKVASLGSQKVKKLVQFLVTQDCDQLKSEFDGIQEPFADKIREGIDTLQQLFQYCESFGVREKVQFDCRAACSLGFYNGVVFKTILTEEPNASVEGSANPTTSKKPPLASGGRYDCLLSRFTDKEVPIYVVGFAFYFEEVFSNYKSKQDIRSKETELFITSDNDNSCINEKIKLCKESWNANINAEMSYFSDSANLHSNTEGIRFIVHIGQSEIPKGLVNLKDTWTKEKISIEASKVTEYVKERLNGKEH